MLRNVPANAVFFPVNELTKHKLADLRNIPVAHLSMPERLFAGACAGLSYWVGTFPLDAIKVSDSHSYSYSYFCSISS